MLFIKNVKHVCQSRPCIPNNCNVISRYAIWPGKTAVAHLSKRFSHETSGLPQRPEREGDETRKIDDVRRNDNAVMIILMHQLLEEQHLCQTYEQMMWNASGSIRCHHSNKIYVPPNNMLTHKGSVPACVSCRFGLKYRRFLFYNGLRITLIYRQLLAVILGERIYRCTNEARSGVSEGDLEEREGKWPVEDTEEKLTRQVMRSGLLVDGMHGVYENERGCAAGMRAWDEDTITEQWRSMRSDGRRRLRCARTDGRPGPLFSFSFSFFCFCASGSVFGVQTCPMAGNAILYPNQPP